MKTCLFILLTLVCSLSAAGDCFNPLVIDRFGAGRFGVPYSYGFQSSVPYYGAYSTLFGGPRLGDYIGPYGPRKDIEYQQSQESLSRASEALERAAGAYVAPYPQGAGSPVSDFETIIRAHCFDCHGPGRQSGGVDFSNVQALDCDTLKLILGSVTRGDKKMPLGRTPLDPREISVIESYVQAACNETPSLPQDNSTTTVIQNTVVKWLEENKGSLISNNGASADEIIEKLMPTLQAMQQQNLEIIKEYIDGKESSSREPFEFEIEVTPDRSN
jgi:mono/diheme cytochrome c family protein